MESPTARAGVWAMRAAMAALREAGGAAVCSRINGSDSHGILSPKIPCRFQPVSESVFGTYDAAFVQAMYEEYLRDPNSVSQEWRGLFLKGKLAGLPVFPPARTPGQAAATPATAPAALPPPPPPLPPPPVPGAT